MNFEKIRQFSHGSNRSFRSKHSPRSRPTKVLLLGILRNNLPELNTLEYCSSDLSSPSSCHVPSSFENYAAKSTLIFLSASEMETNHTCMRTYSMLLFSFRMDFAHIAKECRNV